MNYLVVNLSKASSSISEMKSYEYLSPNGKYYLGRQTNEAPFLSLMEELAENGQLFDKILVLTTEECMLETIPALGNQSTYDHYVEYVRSQYQIAFEKNEALFSALAEKYGSVSTYFSSLFFSISASSNLVADFVDVLNQEDGDEPIQIYLDYSGGSRVTSLLSVLLVRVLTSLDAEVKKIVCADILSSQATIRDCTSEYELLTTIENVAKIEAGSDKKIQRLSRELARIGIDISMDNVTIQQLDNRRNDTLDDFSGEGRGKDSSQGGIGETIPKGLAARIINKEDKLLFKLANQSPYERMIGKSDQELLVKFHSSIIDVFLKNSVIEYVGDSSMDKPQRAVENLLKANDLYYYGDNKKNLGVINTVAGWLQDLYHTQLDPKKYFSQRCAVYNADYKSFSTWNPKSVNKSQFVSFLQYLDEKDIFINGESQFDQFRNLFHKETVFFNKGFPFACMGQGSDSTYYPEITRKYLQSVERLMLKLSDLKREKPEACDEMIEDFLKEPEKLEQEIPYLTDIGWRPNPTLFENEVSAEEFTKDLCARLEEVRPYRNAVAHQLTNQYSGAAARRAEADRIRSWLREYHQRFFKEKEQIE